MSTTNTLSTFNWKDRFKASGIHLSISLVIAALAAALVFGLWYPYPYREISGGRELFSILVVVDVILGPLITFSVFNRNKPWTELRRDLAIVGLLQLGALGYGVWTVFAARPVHMVFEVDRMRVVHAIDIPTELLNKTPNGIEALPLTGATCCLGLRPFKDSNEEMEATMAALGGLHLGSRPDLWQPYAQSKASVLRAAKPLVELKARMKDRTAEIDAAVASTGRTPDTLVYLPLVARNTFWTVLIDPKTADAVGYLPIDSF